MSKSSKQAENGAKSASPKAFDLEKPKLPVSIADKALASGGYPHSKKLKREPFEDELLALQIELLKLQAHVIKSKERLVVVFEGRDSAGKGTCIGHLREHLNPRLARVVALSKPTEVERGQWYFQRYASYLPSAGEIVLFDRSWYNRAGVERVMGFATPDQIANFLREAPEFEGMLVRDGMKFLKIYLEIGREMQIVRFHERRHDPLKQWKIGPIDQEAQRRWKVFTKYAYDMLMATDTTEAPWTIVKTDDKKTARLESMRHVLSTHGDAKTARHLRSDSAVILGVDHDHPPTQI